MSWRTALVALGIALAILSIIPVGLEPVVMVALGVIAIGIGVFPLDRA